MFQYISNSSEQMFLFRFRKQKNASQALGIRLYDHEENASELQMHLRLGTYVCAVQFYLQPLAFFERFCLLLSHLMIRLIVSVNDINAQK